MIVALICPPAGKPAHLLQPKPSILLPPPILYTRLQQMLQGYMDKKAWSAHSCIRLRNTLHIGVKFHNKGI